MGFKVGDRVRTPDGEGEIIGTNGADRSNPSFLVDIPGENDWYYTDEELELISVRGTREHTGEEWAEYQRLSSFEENVHRHTNKIADLLIAKNKAYGDSALNPVRIFSKASRIEQLNVRIDDKISRIQRGTDFGDEDTVRDLVGYLLLRLIAEESE